MIAVSGQGNCAKVRARMLQSVLGQPELAFDALVQQIRKMCAGRHAVAGREFASDRRATDAIRGLEHQHLAPRLAEIGSADQAIVARADNYDAIALSHLASSPAPIPGDADRAISRAQRWRPARP